MTDMTLVCDLFKKIAHEIPAGIHGTALLVAMWKKLGVNDTQELADLCRVSRRMAQIAAKQISSAGETDCAEAKPIAPKAKRISPKTKQVSPSEMDCAPRAPARAHFDFNPSCEEVEDSPLPSVSPPAEKPKRNGTRLPDDWQLPDDWRQWARINFIAVPAETIQFEADKFSAYWRAKAGKQATKLDWRLTWENWCRTAFGPPSGKTGQPMSWGRNAYDEKRARGRALYEDLRARQSGAVQ